MDVVDLEVSSDTGLSFKIDKAKVAEISRDIEDNLNYLIIKDALINDTLLVDILNGEYDNIDLNVKAKGLFVEVETEKYHDFTLKINVARMDSNTVKFNTGQPSDNMLIFSFLTKDSDGLDNSSIKVKKAR